MTLKTQAHGFNNIRAAWQIKDIIEVEPNDLKSETIGF